MAYPFYKLVTNNDNKILYITMENPNPFTELLMVDSDLSNIRNTRVKELSKSISDRMDLEMYRYFTSNEYCDKIINSNFYDVSLMENIKAGYRWKDITWNYKDYGYYYIRRLLHESLSKK